MLDSVHDNMLSYASLAGEYQAELKITLAYLSTAIRNPTEAIDIIRSAMRNIEASLTKNDPSFKKESV